jgi:lipopolysaccharide/colanic/teichoic acid biosynthesis glycosyltransferase
MGMDLLDSSSPRVGGGGTALRRDTELTDGKATSADPRHAASLGRVEAILGRMIDVTVAAVVLLLLSPLLLIIVLAIRLTSDGPALFRQERIGKDKSRFSLYKFRTMRPDASDEPHRKYVRAMIASNQTSQNGDLYKLSVDDRITTIGRYLRSTSLDEIPQLFNVLRGEMSLVGPRPVIGYEAELFPEYYNSRFSVKPGLTGLWQVSGRNQRTYHEMVLFDLEYAERQSLWFDLQILVKTIPVVLSRRGVA